LEATEDELREKGEQLVATLAKSFFFENPELSEVLEKALPAKERVLKFPALQGLKDEARAEYEATLRRMILDIGKVLSEPSAAEDYLQKAGPYIGPKGGL
jgi:hypothetical protein